MKTTDAYYWTIGLIMTVGSSSCGGTPAVNGTSVAGAGAGAGGGQPAAGAAGYLTAGAAGADSTRCGPADPTLADGDAALLFDYPHVPAFDLYLPEQEWEALQVNARDEQYVPAEACFEGKSIGQIGLRFKGYYASLYNCFDETGKMICPRLSMKFKFSEYDKGLRFYGLKRLNFHAYRYDDTRIKQRLTTDLFHAMGIPAARSSWAVVRVNGKTQGLYGMVEELDGRFTADRWPETPDGNLYKEVWPTETNPGSVIAGLQTNEEPANVDAFLAFAQAMRSASDDQLRNTLSQYMDLEYLARYMAVDDATTNYDGITYFWTDGVSTGNHNFFVFEQSPTRFYLVPWDLEGTMWINPDHAAPHWTKLDVDCSLTYPYWDGLARAPACDPVIRAMAMDLSAWRAAVRELLDGPFAEDKMIAAINRYADFIRGEVRVDPTPLTYGTFDGSVEYMRGQVSSFRARMEKLLADSQ